MTAKKTRPEKAPAAPPESIIHALAEMGLESAGTPASINLAAGNKANDDAMPDIKVDTMTGDIRDFLLGCLRASQRRAPMVRPFRRRPEGDNCRSPQPPLNYWSSALFGLSRLKAAKPSGPRLRRSKTMVTKSTWRSWPECTTKTATPCSMRPAPTS